LAKAKKENSLITALKRRCNWTIT